MVDVINKDNKEFCGREKEQTIFVEKMKSNNVVLTQGQWVQHIKTFPKNSSILSISACIRSQLNEHMTGLQVDTIKHSDSHMP